MLPRLELFSPGQLVITAIDIAIVSFLVYRVFLLIRGTRAVQLIKGIIVLLLVTVVSQRFGLVTLNWLMDKVLVMLFVALPVVFQPELRRGLEQIGRGGFFGGRTGLTVADAEETATEVAAAAVALAREGRGALFVIERRTGLREISETGVPIEGRLSWGLLVSLFLADGPLHDGAVIIRGKTVIAAGCFLPLGESLEATSPPGSRHRAAIGITEQTDAVCVVVSEETRELSIAISGKLIPQDYNSLAPNLRQYLVSVEHRGWIR